jgi:large subunit ribosomal protein L21
MKYAVIAISGTQYQVSEGQIITVDHLDLKEGDTSTTDQVLLIVDGEKVDLGTPLVKKATVDYQVIKHYQDKKIRVFKYKAKSRYRKTQGHRSQLTDIKITKINS